MTEDWVWIVHNREYSDGGNICVFTTEQGAAAYCEAVNYANPSGGLKLEYERLQLWQTLPALIHCRYCGGVIVGDAELGWRRPGDSSVCYDAPAPESRIGRHEP